MGGDSTNINMYFYSRIYVTYLNDLINNKSWDLTHVDGFLNHMQWVGVKVCPQNIT